MERIYKIKKSFVDEKGKKVDYEQLCFDMDFYGKTERVEFKALDKYQKSYMLKSCEERK